VNVETGIVGRQNDVGRRRNQAEKLQRERKSWNRKGKYYCQETLEISSAKKKWSLEEGNKNQRQRWHFKERKTYKRGIFSGKVAEGCLGSRGKKKVVEQKREVRISISPECDGIGGP